MTVVPATAMSIAGAPSSSSTASQRAIAAPSRCGANARANASPSIVPSACASSTPRSEPKNAASPIRARTCVSIHAERSYGPDV